jgi:OOP family OmpA-OmpF porin
MNKSTTLIILFFFCSYYSFSQSFNNKWGVYIDYGTIQYNGELGNQLLKFPQWQNGYGAGLSYYLSPSFNIGIRGAYNFIKVIGPDTLTYSMSENMYSFFGNIEYKFANGYIIKEKSIIQPYLKAATGLIWGNSWGSSMDNLGAPYSISLHNLGFLLSAGFRVNISQKISTFIDLGNYWMLATGVDGARADPSKDMLYKINAGITFSFGKSKDKDNDGVTDKYDLCPNSPPKSKVDKRGCPLDMDKDGITDDQDKCPDKFGLIGTKGCPDKDGDNVSDIEDKCPDEPGTIANNGCPENKEDRNNQSVTLPNDNQKASVNIYFVESPIGNGVPVVYSSSYKSGLAFDKDSDNIADNIDRCPDQKGTIENFGCPTAISFDSTYNLPVFNSDPKNPLTIIPGCPGDKDCDGIADGLDKCPDEPGDIRNQGCKTISSYSKWRRDIIVPSVHFAIGSTYLTEYSQERLKKLITILKENSGLNIWIFGHTDAKGSSEINQTISEKRAASVVDYLISNGIESRRIFSLGFGETFPVSFGHTDEDQLLNRRIDFYIFENN